MEQKRLKRLHWKLYKHYSSHSGGLWLLRNYEKIFSVSQNLIWNIQTLINQQQCLKRRLKRIIWSSSRSHSLCTFVDDTSLLPRGASSPSFPQWILFFFPSFVLDTLCFKKQNNAFIFLYSLYSMGPWWENLKTQNALFALSSKNKQKLYVVGFKLLQQRWF